MSAGLLVGLETSGPVGSVAIGREGTILERTFLGERGGHAKAVLPALDRILTGVGAARTDLRAVVVGSGPGSFTGVRVGAAVGKGIASALGLPLFAVSSLRAAARTEGTFPQPQAVEDGIQHRRVLFDARGGRLFSATYALDEGRLSEVRAPEFTDVLSILADPELTAAVLCGDGALANRSVFEEAGRTVLDAPIGFPSADGVLHAFWSEPKPEPVDLAVWEPTYLRASNAERERRG